MFIASADPRNRTSHLRYPKGTLILLPAIRTHRRAEPIRQHWSGRESIKYIKQKGVIHVNQGGCQSAMTTLVQEGSHLNYARHIWHGGRPKIPAHVVRTAGSTERDHPQKAPGDSPHLPSGVPRHLSRDPEGGVHHFQGSRPLLRQLSSTPEWCGAALEQHWSTAPAVVWSSPPWHWPPSSLLPT